MVEGLSSRIVEALGAPHLPAERVIDACAVLSEALCEKIHAPLLEKSGMTRREAASAIVRAKTWLSREHLFQKLEIELSGHLPGQAYEEGGILKKRLPIGVLGHIAPSNAPGTAAVSTVEGLLCGNINLVKLPASGDMVSEYLLDALMTIDPALKDYVHLCTFSSADEAAFSSFLSICDAVVVWGSDRAVAAVRQSAPSNVRIIEWGHKLSFAYMTQAGMTEDNMHALARQMIETRQLLCTSCQGIFLDTRDEKTLTRAGERFLEALEACGDALCFQTSPAMRAQVTIEARVAMLERPNGLKILRGVRFSVWVMNDDAPQPSIGYGNPWMKALPRDEIIKKLRPYKSHLQTVGLACEKTEWDELCARFERTGTTHILPPQGLFHEPAGWPHDGCYALERYSKVVVIGTGTR